MLADEIFLYRRHNSAGAFCVWVKELGNDFSTELTENSNILLI